MLTFKQYLDSKDQLKNRLEQTPYSIREYEIKKYCSISLGENEQDKIIVGLKPKQKIIVEWLYTDINNPDIVGIKIQGRNTLNEDQQYKMYWSSEKMRKWLARYTREGIQNGF